MKTGILIFAHGSPIESANEAIRTVAGDVARAGGFDLVEAAFLDDGEPDLAGGVERMAAQGAERVVIVPYFLTLGLHLQRDLPRIIEDLSRSHRRMEIEVTAPLDGHPGLAAIVIDRAREALARRR